MNVGSDPGGVKTHEVSFERVSVKAMPEPRIIFISEKLAQELFANGQVYSQYCTEDGKPTMLEPENPNGSAFAIEGLTSPDGLVLGKMGHSERTVGIGGFNPDLIKNIACNKEASSCQNLFRAGVRYFG